MSFALRELSKLLTVDTTTLGVVVSVEPSMIKVATAKGAMTVKTLETLIVGDRVLISQGLARKAPVAQQTFPV
jgi:outer membrane usher protein FimD/PapC